MERSGEDEAGGSAAGEVTVEHEDEAGTGEVEKVEGEKEPATENKIVGESRAENENNGIAKGGKINNSKNFWGCKIGDIGDCI